MDKIKVIISGTWEYDPAAYPDSVENVVDAVAFEKEGYDKAVIGLYDLVDFISGDSLEVKFEAA